MRFTKGLSWLFNPEINGSRNYFSPVMTLFRFFLYIGIAFMVIRFGVHLIEAIRNDLEEPRRNEVLKCVLDFIVLIVMIIVVPDIVARFWFAGAAGI